MSNHFGVIGSMRKEGNRGGGGGEKREKLSRFSGSDEKNIKFDQSAFTMAR